MTLLLAKPSASQAISGSAFSSHEVRKRQSPRSQGTNLGLCGSALGGIRTPNLLIRSQMLYPLSYERVPLGV
jgi:hypothetical protein